MVKKVNESTLREREGAFRSILCCVIDLSIYKLQLFT